MPEIEHFFEILRDLANVAGEVKVTLELVEVILALWESRRRKH